MSSGLCSFSGCIRQPRAKGLCSGHYSQHHAGKELSPIRERRVPTGEKRTRRDVFLWLHYRLTLEQYDNLAANGCTLCGTVEDLVVDHDHDCCTGKRSCGDCVRGVLCRTHNVWLGMVGDDPNFLVKATEYLRSRVQ